MKARPEHDEHEAGDLRARLRSTEPPSAAARRAENDEDDGEAEDEGHARRNDAARHPALAEPVDLDRRDRREVAGHERQHAGR